MSKQKINILIVDNNSPFVLPLVRSFSGYKNIHLDVLVFSEMKLQNFSYSKYLRSVYCIKELNDENCEQILKEYIEKSGAHLIIPTREQISILFFAHKHFLEKIVKVHPVSSPDIIETANDKLLLDQWLKKNGYPHSSAVPVSKDITGKDNCHSLSFPLLLKPIIGIGGEGIRLVDNEEELKKLLSEEERFQHDYFLQEFIEGYDIDISFFSIEGEILFYTIQRGIISASFTFSRGIEFVKSSELYEQTERMIRQMNYTGIAHLDFRYDQKTGDYVLVDFNGRYWSSVQGSRAMGVNFPFLAAAYSLNNPYEIPEYTTGRYYFGTTALKVALNNIFSKKRSPIRLRNTQIYYIISDPKPELIFIIRQLIKSFKRICRRTKDPVN